MGHLGPAVIQTNNTNNTNLTTKKWSTIGQWLIWWISLHAVKSRDGLAALNQCILIRHICLEADDVFVSQDVASEEKRRTSHREWTLATSGRSLVHCVLTYAKIITLLTAESLSDVLYNTNLFFRRWAKKFGPESQTISELRNVDFSSRPLLTHICRQFFFKHMHQPR